MNDHLKELYQEVILDHNRHPRNHSKMPDATHHAEGFNPLCGDKIDVYLHVENQHIQKVSFKGCGCAISQASASIMTEMVLNHSVQEAEALFQRVHQLMLSDEPMNSAMNPVMDKLTVLSGVRAYPARVKCATLAWHTLDAALHHQAQAVSTES